MIARSLWYAGAAVAAAAVSLVATAARPDGDDAAALDGATVFVTKGCAACHDGPAGPSMTHAGPSLVAAATWAGDRVASMSAEEYIAQSIRNPSAVISPAYTGATSGPGGGMPLLQVSDEEIDALVAYLLEPTAVDSGSVTSPPPTD